jgi:glucose-1-phosphate cytidylyltransferase
MKVVLFCGGFGMRLREFSESIPKPMVTIGYRPILWHVMKYYAHFGVKEFILCLGWKADVIKQYFLNYSECLSNDFVLTGGGSNVSLLSSDIDDWKITFVDTGTASNIGQRLKAAQPYLEGEETFLANYADGLTDFHLPTLIDFHHDQQAVASFLSVKPSYSFHTVQAGADGRVSKVQAINHADVWMNGGFFVLNQKIFDHMHPGEELVVEPFNRLIESQQLCTMKYEGFWGCMDTFKEKQMLDDMYTRGVTPWELWKQAEPSLGSANLKRIVSPLPLQTAPLNTTLTESPIC